MKMGKGRAPCCDKSKVNRGPWSAMEDLRLVNFIQKHGHGNWRALPKQAGLLRCGKSCRLRWINYLSPDVKRGNYTPEELQTIINLHDSYGNKWSKIASCLPGRTDNEIKNVWNTHLKKRVTEKKITADSQKNGTHDSKIDCLDSPSSASSTLTDTEKASDHQELQELEVKKPDKNPEPNETANSDSPTSCESNASNSDKDNNDIGLNEDSGFPNQDIINRENGSQDGEIVIPFDSGLDFWELLDSFDPLQPNETEQNGSAQDSNPSKPEEMFDSEVDCSSWIKFLENELGLTSENDNLPNYQDLTPTTQQNQEMDFEQEICPIFDDFPIWPDSPGNPSF